MKISVCITIYNEEKSIRKLLESLLSQTKKPDEITIVDGGSSDKTVDVIRHFQKQDKRIKLLVEKCTRAQGRNLSVEIAKNDIIAITDGDCFADKLWLKRITRPFIHESVEMVAGFYQMDVDTTFKKAISVFIAVTPKRFSHDFLPSTRSIAFRKSLWERVGGFPEMADNSAEDTDFNYKVVKDGAKIARVKSALVYWKIPDSLNEAMKKFYNYAKWDIKSGIIWHPTHKYASHNIKIILVFLRYIFGLGLLIYSIKFPLFYVILFLAILSYFYWAFKKVFQEYGDLQASLYGVLIQIVVDCSVMAGFIIGLYEKYFKTRAN